MLIIAIVGTFTSDVRFHSIQFNNKDACVKAAKEAKESSSAAIGYICVSNDTGETIKFISK